MLSSKSRSEMPSLIWGFVSIKLGVDQTMRLQDYNVLVVEYVNLAIATVAIARAHAHVDLDQKTSSCSPLSSLNLSLPAQSLSSMTLLSAGLSSAWSPRSA
jgi:hypothetical protein